MSKRSIVHVEIPAKNPKKDAEFYQQMFGWDIRHAEEPVAYTMFESGNIGGGFPTLGDGYQPGDVLIYIDSDDIEADLKKAKGLGAKVLHEKMEIPGAGWMAWLEDPSGNRIALWTSTDQ